MRYSTRRQISDAKHITRSAEQKIKSKTGMCVNLVLCHEYHLSRTPEKMLYIIAGALGMDTECYKQRTRERAVVELRFIAAYLLRSYFPTVTLHQITMFFGGQDHTSIINGIARAHKLIDSGDPRFLGKYDTVLKSINIWLRKETSEYASAISA